MHIYKYVLDCRAICIGICSMLELHNLAKTLTHTQGQIAVAQMSLKLFFRPTEELKKHSTHTHSCCTKKNIAKKNEGKP